MSYCRFSTDCYSSDVYVYDDVAGGVTVHVAGARVVSDQPRPARPDCLSDPIGALAYMKAVGAWADGARHEPIEDDLAGVSRFNLSPVEAAEFLRELKMRGYRIPEGVIEAVEQSEQSP